MNALENEIKHLINLCAEGDYWDYKLEWHNNKAELLYDVICMANNQVNKDYYIIIGVNDDGEVVELDNSIEYRKRQQDIICLLKDKKFAAGIRPTIYVQSFIVDEKK